MKMRFTKSPFTLAVALSWLVMAPLRIGMWDTRSEPETEAFDTASSAVGA